MSIVSLALLAHVVGACGLFAALGADWIAQRGLEEATTVARLRQAMRVFSQQAWIGVPSVLALLASGLYLATVTQAWRAPWVLGGLAAMVAIAVTGGALTGRTFMGLGRAMPALDEGPLPEGLLANVPRLVLSLRIRTVLVFAALTLMVLKPDLVGTAVVWAIAAGAIGVLGARRAPRPAQA